MDSESRPRKRRCLLPSDSQPFVLKQLVEDLPLKAGEDQAEVSITCIEHWNENLYIGTSASEIIHLVAIPAEQQDGPPTYILASRLQPSGHSTAPIANQPPGVRQIIVLPGPLKACVLCNGVLSFYTLPELSPASPSKEPTGVQWIGGIDANEGQENIEGHVIMMANSRRIMLIRVGERLRNVSHIDFPGCLRSSRRDTIACVANDTNYALLEVEHQQQIPLFPISSSEVTSVSSSIGTATAASTHNRSTSLGNLLSIDGQSSDLLVGGGKLDLTNPSQSNTARATSGSAHQSGRPRSSTEASPVRVASAGITKRLMPHILTTSPAEFMLTTGTNHTEPGVGMFVNLDGDVVRGTIEFERYPDDVLVYNFDQSGISSTDSSDQHVLALLDKTNIVRGERGLEVQALSDMMETTVPKIWLPFPKQSPTSSPGGLFRCLTAHKHSFSEVTELLRAVRFKPAILEIIDDNDSRTMTSIRRSEDETNLFNDQSSTLERPTPEYEAHRNDEERNFVKRLAQASTEAIAWSGDNVWQILPNPVLFQLEFELQQCGYLVEDTYVFDSINVSKIISLLGSIREKEPKNEVEFLALNYIRQKSSLILFLHLQTAILQNQEIDSLCHIVRSALLESSIDPRIVLLLVLPVAKEVLQGQNGVWVYQGIVDMLDSPARMISSFEDASTAFWLMLRQFLGEWQEKRGYGSISDEKHVFDSVDASLLHILLYLDQALPEGSGAQVSTRAKLNNVVDHWKGDFPRAIYLLENYRRLFVLSRLYQSRKLAKAVLSTWKRIAEGEYDADKSLTVETVEIQVRKYLTKIGNANLVQEYGLWLAKRNADLAVQLFADDSTRVKFSPAEVVIMLKDKAPGAVQQYLEHLVFSKQLDQYADDLIGYYLDSVLNVLETSHEARESLKESYAAYRALESPKPTYLNFIKENAPPQTWWKSRLRLLQLLGSGGYSTRERAGKELTYSVDRVLERLTPFSSFLVSESVILDARQGRHHEALRLLTHGLGDYDTAVRYCYFGGPGPTGSQPLDAGLLPSRNMQQDLFLFLFREFLQIEDAEEKLERTSHLLGTFATWFEPLTIFGEIPQDWPVDLVSEFILKSFRAATSERNEALIMKALSAAQNLQKQADFIELCEKLGPKLETDETKLNFESNGVDAI